MRKYHFKVVYNLPGSTNTHLAARQFGVSELYLTHGLTRVDAVHGSEYDSELASVRRNNGVRAERLLPQRGSGKCLHFEVNN